MIFDDYKSFFHTIYGVINGILLASNDYVAVALAYIMFVVFLVYQLVEKENIYNKIGDFIEYGIGLGIGILIEKDYNVLKIFMVD